MLTEGKPNQIFDDGVGVLGKPAVLRSFSPKGPGKYEARRNIGDSDEPERGLTRGRKAEA